VSNTGDGLLSQNSSFRRAATVIVMFAVVQFIIQLSLLTRGMEYAAASLIIDDTYYYLQTAWNAKLLGFVTFDGLHATNGVQLLWFVIIYLLALLSTSKVALLFTTLAVNFLFNGLCYLVILKIGAILKQPVIALFMAGLWALQSLPFRIYSIGMENSLHALIFWCVLWQSAEFLIRVQNQDKPNFRGLTVVLILNAWTRLDSALLSAIIFTFCVGMLAYTYRDNLRLFFQRHGKIILASSILAAMGLLVQMASFQLMGDSFLPVSALVKTSAAGRGVNVEPLEKLVNVFTLGMPSILQGRFPDVVLISLGVFGVLLVILARVMIGAQSDEMRAFHNLWLCLLACEIIYYVYVALSQVEYAPYFIWYRSPSFIFWIATGSLLALSVFVHPRLAKYSSRTFRWAPIVSSVAIFVVAIYMFVRAINFTSTLYVARYDVALWMADNSPPDTVFAAWNAGQLSFFSNRTVINLDGVINSVDYYERVLVGSTSLVEYLGENNVDYIVDYSMYRELPDYPIIQTFPLNDETGRSIHIWQVSSERSLNP
jgi:hypothetical protein